MADGQLDTLAFSANHDTLQIAIQEQMTAKFKEMNAGATPGYLENMAISANSTLVATLTQQALQDVKAEGIGTDDTPQSVAERVAQRVGEKLGESNDSFFLAAKAKVGETYIPNIQSGLQDALSANFATHATEFAALKPAPAQAAHEVETIQATPTPAPVVAEAAPPSPPVAEPTPAETRRTGVVDTVAGMIAPAAEAATIPTGESPLPGVDADTTPGGDTYETAEAARPLVAQPPARTDGETPPPPTAETAPPPPPEANMPGMLSEIFTTASGISDSQRREMIGAYAGLLTAPEARGTIKEMIRGSIRKAGQDPADYEENIDGMASVLQEAGGEWIARNRTELENGNLSTDRINQLSVELATGVRSRMTQERVGKFAERTALVVDTVEIITGIDAEGNVSHPYDMNIFGMTRAALSGVAGNQDAKETFRERIAHEDSHRQFYANSEEGVTQEMATQAARARAAQAGYSGYTQDAVAGMTANAYAGSATDYVKNPWFYLMELLSALFTGNLDNFLVGMQDGSLSAARREQHAQHNNFTLFNRLLSSDAQTLGYTGDPAGFDQWRANLATEVTGIRRNPANGNFIDMAEDGSVQGLSALAQGLDMNGNSRIAGLEGTHAAIVSPTAQPGEIALEGVFATRGSTVTTLPGGQDDEPAHGLPPGRQSNAPLAIPR